MHLAGKKFLFELKVNNVSDFLSRANYLRIAQANDKKLMYNTVQAKNDYKNQKDIFEEKKEKVESLKKQLDDYTAQIDEQKAIKQNLLTTTRNDESKFQQLLAAARARRFSLPAGRRRAAPHRFDGGVSFDRL